jgi:hypothetical protein
MQRRIHALAACVLISSVLAACSDEAPTSLKRMPTPSFALSDGASGGNPHFYFLRPVPPNNPSFSGAFNTDLYPTVEICTGLSQTANGHCSTLLASFTMNGGVNNQGDLVSIPNGEEMYRVEWHTPNYNIAIDQPLRIVVMLGNFMAGYVDVVKGADGKFRDSDDKIIPGSNSTLPIKFRIEKGVICGDAPTCIENAIGENSETVTNGVVGAYFPQEVTDEPVNLVIEEVTSGECLPTDLQQFRQCFHFSTEPEVDEFNEEVTVGVCLTDPAGIPYYNNGELRLWKWSEVPGDALKELPKVPVDFLNCPDLTSMEFGSSSAVVRRMAHISNKLFGPVTRMIAPKSLYAGIYEGGKLGNFSRIGWVRPISVEITQGNNQTGYPGFPLPVNPTVRVRNRYGATGAGIAGWNVEFTASPNGSASPASVTSNASGLASTVWTLSTTVGANTLLAYVPTSRPVAPAPYETQITFNATAVELVKVKWLPPLVQNSSVTGILLTGLTPTVVITEVGGPTLATLNAVESTSQYSANWDIPALDKNKTYKVALWTNGAERSAVLLQVVNNELRNVTTGDKVLNLKNSRTLPIKVVLYR